MAERIRKAKCRKPILFAAILVALVASVFAFYLRWQVPGEMMRWSLLGDQRAFVVEAGDGCVGVGYIRSYDATHAQAVGQRLSPTGERRFWGGDGLE